MFNIFNWLKKLKTNTSVALDTFSYVDEALYNERKARMSLIDKLDKSIKSHEKSIIDLNKNAVATNEIAILHEDRMSNLESQMAKLMDDCNHLCVETRRLLQKNKQHKKKGI